MLLWPPVVLRHGKSRTKTLPANQPYENKRTWTACREPLVALQNAELGVTVTNRPWVAHTVYAPLIPAGM